MTGNCWWQPVAKSWIGHSDGGGSPAVGAGEALHYDFYMGVDVLANQVIYVFVCGKGGRNVWVQRGDQLRRRGLTEKN